MATVRKDATCALKLKFVIGHGIDGKEKYKLTVFDNVNPEVTDEDVYDVGNGIARLQLSTVDSILRADSSSIWKQA